MWHYWRQITRIRTLVPVFLIAVAVTLFGTLAGSVFDHVHKVDAEELTAGETAAVVGPAGTQVIIVADWGVQLTAPLAAELPTLKYTTRSGNAVGFSSADLEQHGSACIAGRGGLGTLLRFSAGEFAKTLNADLGKIFVSTVNGYDYAYQKPQNACSDTPAGAEITNREVSALFAAFDSLSAIPAK